MSSVLNFRWLVGKTIICCTPGTSTTASTVMIVFPVLLCQTA